MERIVVTFEEAEHCMKTSSDVLVEHDGKRFYFSQQKGRIVSCFYEKASTSWKNTNTPYVIISDPFCTYKRLYKGYKVLTLCEAEVKLEKGNILLLIRGGNWFSLYSLGKVTICSSISKNASDPSTEIFYYHQYRDIILSTGNDTLQKILPPIGYIQYFIDLKKRELKSYEDALLELQNQMRP